MDPTNIVLFTFVGFSAGVIVTSLFFLLRKRKGEVMDSKDTKVQVESDKIIESYLPPPIIGEPFIELSMDNIVTPIDTITFWKDDNLIDELHSSSALVEKYLESSTQSPTATYSTISQVDIPSVSKSIEPFSQPNESSKSSRKDQSLGQNKPSLSINIIDTIKGKTQKKNGQKQNNLKDQESLKIENIKHKAASKDSFKDSSKDSLFSKPKSLLSDKRSSKSSTSSRKATERKSIISNQQITIEAESSENDEDDMPLGLKQFTVSK